MSVEKKKLRTERIPEHKLIEEALRSYTTFREHFGFTGDHVLEHSYIVYNEDGSRKEKVTQVISLFDLFNGVKNLSPRKRQAIWYIAIQGYTQEEVGRIMGCRAVTCGQYLKAGCMQLAKEIYQEQVEEEE
jgi:DNA-directed RNA polymerase specialized sigma24 family protein